MPSGGIGQAREVLVFQGQEVVGEAGKVRDFDEETANDEDGLVVWLGRISECPEIPGFVDEADLQGHPPEKAMATGWWPWGPPPTWGWPLRISEESVALRSGAS